MAANLLYLAWNEIEANEAAFGQSFDPPTRSNRARHALAVRVAQGASDAMRQAVWALCADAVRHAAQAKRLTHRPR